MISVLDGKIMLVLIGVDSKAGHKYTRKHAPLLQSDKVQFTLAFHIASLLCEL